MIRSSFPAPQSLFLLLFQKRSDWMPTGIHNPAKLPVAGLQNAVDRHELHAGCIFPVLIGISVGNVRQPRSR